MSDIDDTPKSPTSDRRSSPKKAASSLDWIGAVDYQDGSGLRAVEILRRREAEAAACNPQQGEGDEPKEEDLP